MNDHSVADTIYQQLGGNKFAVMTGAKYFAYGDNSLTFIIPRNKSRANTVKITLRGDDTYDMAFRQITLPKLSHKTWTFSKGKDIVIREFNCVYFDQLQELCTEVTGMYTRL